MNDTSSASGGQPGSPPPARRWGVRVVVWLAGAAVIGLLFATLGPRLVECLCVRRAHLSLTDPTTDESWVAAQLLAAEDIGVPSPATLLVLLDSDKPVIRKGAGIALYAWPSSEDPAKLKRFYADPDATVRVGALAAGADCGDVEALRGLVDFMKKSERLTDQYREAAHTLARGCFREAGDDLAARIPAGKEDLFWLMPQLERMLAAKGFKVAPRGGKIEEMEKAAPALVAAWQEARSQYRSADDFRETDRGWRPRKIVGIGRKTLLQLLFMAEGAWLVGFWAIVLVRSRRG